MIDLSNYLERKKLVLQINKDIDEFCQRGSSSNPRTHLGASIIGHDCKAYGWNTFRWLKFEQFNGRMLRLFNRGHEEEQRFIRWLKGAGFQVFDIDPDTGKQFRISGVNGHFGGSLDSLIYLPPNYNINEPLAWLGEFKTHSESSFAKLAGPILCRTPDIKRDTNKAKGVCGSKPQHFRQMCSYGRAYTLKYGLYCAVNKDTDELYFEIIVLDYRQADDLFRKAENIIYSQTQPQKIAQVETYFDCKFCDFSNICHKGELPTKNCRSCRNATPADEGNWFCSLYNSNIPLDFISKGCDNWYPIING